jgi:nitroreductase
MSSVLNAIRQRRSHKSFSQRPLSDDEIRMMLEGAILAPNHKLTQPWGFVVLGKLSRRKYGEIKAASKVKGEMNTDFAAAKREKLAAEIAAVPGVIVVTQKLAPDPLRMKEDYAAVYMAIQNMLLLATSMGLGSKVHTGSIMDEAPMRELVGVAEDERVVAVVHVGEPAEELPAKPRIPVAEITRWLP